MKKCMACDKLIHDDDALSLYVELDDITYSPICGSCHKDLSRIDTGE